MKFSNLTLVMFLHYLALHKTKNLCQLPLNSVSGSEENEYGKEPVVQLDHSRCSK